MLHSLAILRRAACRILNATSRFHPLIRNGDRIGSSLAAVDRPTFAPMLRLVNRWPNPTSRTTCRHRTDPLNPIPHLGRSVLLGMTEGQDRNEADVTIAPADHHAQRETRGENVLHGLLAMQIKNQTKSNPVAKGYLALREQPGQQGRSQVRIVHLEGIAEIDLLVQTATIDLLAWTAVIGLHDQKGVIDLRDQRAVTDPHALIAVIDLHEQRVVTDKIDPQDLSVPSERPDQNVPRVLPGLKDQPGVTAPRESKAARDAHPVIDQNEQNVQLLQEEIETHLPTEDLMRRFPKSHLALEQASKRTMPLVSLTPPMSQSTISNNWKRATRVIPT